MSFSTLFPAFLVNAEKIGLFNCCILNNEWIEGLFHSSLSEKFLCS